MKRSIYFLLASCAVIFFYAQSTSGFFFGSDNRDFFPLGTKQVLFYEDDRGIKSSLRWTEQFDHKGITVYTQKYSIGDAWTLSFYSKSDEGIYSVGVQPYNQPRKMNSERHCLFKLPIKTGAVWASNLNDGQVIVIYKVETDNETVTVPAGTFRNCLKVRSDWSPSPMTTNTWYADKIGMVKSERIQPDYQRVVQLVSISNQ